MYRIFTVLLLSVSPIFGVIQELNHFSELKKHVDNKTLLLLDIDDTLIIPNQMLGNSEWFEYRWKSHQNLGLDRSASLEKTLAEWEAIRHLSQMRLVEPEISETLASLQKRGGSLIHKDTRKLRSSGRG